MQHACFPSLSVDGHLTGKLKSDLRYEYVSNEVRGIAGACEASDLNARNVASRLRGVCLLPSRVGGFTLVELVIVMIIIGILAVSVLPRFADQSVFEGRGFHDETLALLRYAQKSAIAQRRTVCIAFTATTAILTIASAAGSSNCNTNLIGPSGVSPYTVTAKTGINYAAVPTNFNFNALGSPSTTQSLQVSGIAQTVTIETETGYIHE